MQWKPQKVQIHVAETLAETLAVLMLLHKLQSVIQVMITSRTLRFAIVYAAKNDRGYASEFTFNCNRCVNAN